MKSSCIIKPAMNLETLLYICHPFRTTRILWQEIRALLTERNLPLPNDISLCRHLDLAKILLSSCRFLLCCVDAFIRVHTFQSMSSSGTVLAMRRIFGLFVFFCVLAWKPLEFLRPRAKLPREANQCVLGLHVSHAVSASPVGSTWFPTCWPHCEALDLQSYRATPSKVFQGWWEGCHDLGFVLSGGGESWCCF